jgi:3-mercaptopyruvate sulfurtransferase SseA
MGKKLTVFCIVAVSFLIGPVVVRAADKTPEQLVAEAKAAVREVTIQDVKKMIDNKEKVIILDVREKDEYRQGHLPGAINMSRGLVDLHVHEIIPDKTTKIVLY